MKLLKATVAILTFCLISGGLCSRVQSEDSQRLPSGHYLYLGSGVGKPVPFTVTENGSIRWQTNSDPSKSEPTSGKPEQTSVTSDSESPAARSAPKPQLAKMTSQNNAVNGGMPAPIAAPTTAPTMQPLRKTHDIAKVEGSVIYWDVKPVKGSKLMAALITSSDSGGSLRYQITLAGTRKAFKDFTGVTVSLEDQSGFKVDSFFVGSGEFQPSDDGMNLVAKGDARSISVRRQYDYQNLRHWSITSGAAGSGFPIF